MNVIVDVQGFKSDSNNFIVKEIAILYNNQLQVYLIKPPYPFYNLSKTEMKQVSWIERNRGIYWKEGYIPYLSYNNNICKFLHDKNIYTKGIEKMLWIKEITRNNHVYNLEDKGCPSFMELYETYKLSKEVYACIHHNQICALKNVMCLNIWCKDNKVL